MTQPLYKESRSMTPWGKSDQALSLCRGVVSYNTPSHGGLSVSPGWGLKNLSPQAQALGTRQYGRLWYEEDAQCALVYYERPELLRVASPAYCAGKDDATLRGALEPILRKYYPQYFNPVFIALCRVSVPIPPTLTEGCAVQLRGSEKRFIVLDTNTRNGYLLEHSGKRYYAPKGRIFDDCVEVRRPMPDGSYKTWQDPAEKWQERS